MSHRESSLLRRPFQRQSITVLGTQTSVLFLQKLPGVAQTSLFASASVPLAPPHHLGVPATVPKSWATIRPAPSIPPQHLHLIYACVNFQLVNLGVRDARAVEIPHVWPSAVGVRARIPHHQSHLSRARAPSLSSPDGESGKTNTSTIVSARARAVRVRARHQEAAMTA